MNDKLLTGVTAVLFILGLGCILYVAIGNFKQEMSVQSFGNLGCVERTQIMSNSEESMAGIVPLQSKIKIMHNYYSCNKVTRKDMVLFQFSKSIPPVVRVAYGLPGDKFKVTQEGDKWTVNINGENVSGSGGQFIITSQNTPPLKTYEISRKGILKDREYIIFADKSPSISDSSNLGIVKFETLIGRAFKLDEAPGS